MDQGAPSARGAACACGLRPFTAAPALGVFLASPTHLPPAGATRLRDDGLVLAGCSEWDRGVSSRLPLRPVRTYQEPPEGPRSFVRWGAPSWPLWRLLIALRVG